MTRLATCAGFRHDVLEAIRAHGARIELGDHVPFTEVFGDGDRGLVALLVATANRLRDDLPLAFEEMFGPVCVEQDTVHARPLTRAAFAVLAAFDDLALSALWTAAWSALGHAGSPPGEWTEPIRGLVVQCRAAQANGWEVFVVEES